MRDRLKTGIGWGWRFAAVYIVFVLGLFLLRGPGPFERSGTTLPMVIAAYAIAGMIGGGVFGLLLPLGRTRLGAAFLGLIVAVPVMHVVSLAVDLEGAPRLTVVLLTAALLGPMSGVGLWYVNSSFDRWT
jgi:hypothetical protein